MKLSIVLLLSVIILSGCNQTENKRVINFADENYLPQEVVDEKAQVDYLFSKMNWDEIEKLYDETNPGTKRFLAYLFVSDMGSIDKIVIAKSLGKTIDDKIVSEMEKWQISPAKKDGKNVKSILEYFFMKDKSGIVFAESSNNNYIPAPPPPPNFDDSEFLFDADEMPLPIGGIMEIQKHIVYPELAKRTGTEGKVLIKAWINEKGFVIGTEVVKGIGAGCDQAAVDAVRATTFTPGKNGGKNVKTQIIIPIMFKLS